MIFTARGAVVGMLDPRSFGTTCHPGPQGARPTRPRIGDPETEPHESTGERLPGTVFGRLVTCAPRSWLGSRTGTCRRGRSRPHPDHPRLPAVGGDWSRELVVHGYLRSRAIPRTAIIEVMDSSTVLWTDSSGKRRRTPILAFNTQPGTMPSITQHAGRDSGNGFAAGSHRT